MRFSDPDLLISVHHLTMNDGMIPLQNTRAFGVDNTKRKKGLMIRESLDGLINADPWDPNGTETLFQHVYRGHISNEDEPNGKWKYINPANGDFVSFVDHIKDLVRGIFSNIKPENTGNITVHKNQNETISDGVNRGRIRKTYRVFIPPEFIPNINGPFWTQSRDGITLNLEKFKDPPRTPQERRARYQVFSFQPGP